VWDSLRDVIDWECVIGWSGGQSPCVMRESGRLLG